MKKTKPKLPEKPRCSVCKSSQVYHQSKTSTRRCRLCGNVEPVTVNRVPVRITNIHN